MVVLDLIQSKISYEINIWCLGTTQTSFFCIDILHKTKPSMPSYPTALNAHDKCEACLHRANNYDSIFDATTFVKGERLPVKGLDCSKILLLYKGKIQMKCQDSKSVLLIRQGEMTLFLEKITTELDVLEDGVALFMKVDNYDSICKITISLANLVGQLSDRWSK